MPLLSVEDLSVQFCTQQGAVRVVDRVSFCLEPGETLGVVGESGSGKSVTCLALMGLLPQPQGIVESGAARFRDVDLLNCDPATLRGIRGRRIAMVFQDPMTALNPYMRISDQLTEPLRVHYRLNRKRALEEAVRALEEVGIASAAERIHQYPHHYSGGMRQRAMIAMALLTRPDILIADEPTTALDVTSQAQLLDLIKQMQRDLGTAVILVTHNLGVVARACDRVMVMYAGRVLESGTVDDILLHPAHPYSAALRHAVPSNESMEELETIPGSPPAPEEVPEGCPFAPRCNYRLPKCLSGRMELREVSPGHLTACVRIQEQELPPLE